MIIRTLKKRYGILPDFRLLIGIGQICLVAAIFLGRMEPPYGWTDFVEGVLLGFATVANLVGLAVFGRQGPWKGDNHGEH
jgi:hypothetical protein